MNINLHFIKKRCCHNTFFSFAGQQEQPIPGWPCATLQSAVAEFLLWESRGKGQKWLHNSCVCCWLQELRWQRDKSQGCTPGSGNLCWDVFLCLNGSVQVPAAQPGNNNCLFLTTVTTHPGISGSPGMSPLNPLTDNQPCGDLMCWKSWEKQSRKPILGEKV